MTMTRLRAAIIGISLAAALALAGLVLLGPGAGPPPIGGPFTLAGPDGKPVTDRDFRGRYMLVYFGYTNCPDVCPTTLAEMSTALDDLGAKAARVQPVFITVDPARDTPASLQHYTAAFSPKLLGLSGTPEQIKAVTGEYGVYYARHDTGDGSYSMDHSSVLYLMGPDGAFVAPIRADADGAAMAAEIGKQLG